MGKRRPVPVRDLHLKYAVSDLQRPLTQGPHTKFRFEPSQIEALMAYVDRISMALDYRP